MRVGMTLPTMAPEAMDRATLLDWCRAVDQGPFSSLAVGERLAFPNLEIRVALAAAAAVTERVQLVATILVLPLHRAAWLAKQLASIDQIAGGRLVVGVGVGGREEDYRVAGASFERRHARMDEQVATLHATWAQSLLPGASAAIGPPPMRAAGPPIWAAASGARPLARAARWAEGIAGFSLGPDAAETADLFGRADQAWAEAGRPDRPWHATSFWYALGGDAAPRLDAYARRYLGVFGEAPAQAMAARCRAAGSEALGDALLSLREAGADEVILVPTSTSLADLDATGSLLARLGLVAAAPDVDPVGVPS